MRLGDENIYVYAMHGDVPRTHGRDRRRLWYAVGMAVDFSVLVGCEDESDWKEM